MSELFAISPVDRRKESVRVQQNAHSNVAQTSPGTDLSANNEMQNEGGGKQKRGQERGTDDDRSVFEEDPDAHNCDVTV